MLILQSVVTSELTRGDWITIIVAVILAAIVAEEYFNEADRDKED